MDKDRSLPGRSRVLIGGPQGAGGEPRAHGRPDGIGEGGAGRCQPADILIYFVGILIPPETDEAMRPVSPKNQG